MLNKKVDFWRGSDTIKHNQLLKPRHGYKIEIGVRNNPVKLAANSPAANSLPIKIAANSKPCEVSCQFTSCQFAAN